MGECCFNQEQTINALPDTFMGKIKSEDIHVSPDGLFLYATNRGTSTSITMFFNEANGSLAFANCQFKQGLTPQNLSIDPSGNFLSIANQDSGEIV
ncbi:MAG: beta-propeller fold lactonase family protein, partial [Ferruginibacter sp.]|nr:beta-propeller fold lactonase family protein [Ferruginibacter sp.]